MPPLKKVDYQNLARNIFIAIPLIKLYPLCFLGPALGGSIGLMFTMANTISVATYTIGFSESMLDLLADIVPSWNGIVVPQDECAVAGCRDMDVRIIAAPCLGKFFFDIRC